jgi:hypothetical protein
MEINVSLLVGINGNQFDVYKYINQNLIFGTT